MITCFKNAKISCNNCEKKTCRYWINSQQYQNCTLIMSEENSHTFEAIGQTMNMSKTKVRSIYNAALEKMKTSLHELCN